MNLLAKKIGTGILGMLVLFLACEDPSDIGLILTPDDQTGLFFKELPVLVNTTLINNINTETARGETNGVVGIVNDPDFGILKSSLHAQFGPERVRSGGEQLVNPDPDTTTFISANLKLSGGYFRSVDFNEDQIFRVYRIFEDLSPDSVYVSSDTVVHINPETMMPEFLGEETFKFIPRSDTVNLVEVDIELTDEFGMELLEALENQISDVNRRTSKIS